MGPDGIERGSERERELEHELQLELERERESEREQEQEQARDHDTGGRDAPSSHEVAGYQDGTARARVAQGLLALNALLYVVMCASLLLDPLGVASEALWGVVDSFWEAAEGVEIGLRLITALGFLAWIHLASTNAHAIGDPTPQHSPGAAIGYWFVPCGNLWLPYQVVSELDRTSDPESAGATSGWTAGWWAAWIASTFISRFVANGVAVPSLVVSFGVLVLHFAAAVLAIVVVERITRNQAARARRADSSTIAEVFA